MADEKIVITISGNINADVARRIRDIAHAALEADNALTLLKSELRQFSAVQGLKQAANDTRTFKREIVGANTEARKFLGTIKQVDGSTVRLHRSSSALGSSLGQLAGLFGGVFAIGQYAQAQDALTTTQNLIKTITNGTGEAARLQETLFALANRTRSGIEQTTAAYVNFYKNLSAIGAGEAEVLRIVETINKGFIVGGKNAAEASGSVRQFIQGLQNGALRGEEFNSVMEGFPVEIIDEFAKTLGVSRGELRKMAEQGAITADVIRESLGNAAVSVDELFARMTPTINGALTVLNNKFIEFTDSTTGGAGLLADAIMLIGDNLNIIIPVVAAFAGAWALLKIAGIVGGIYTLTTALIALAPVLVTNAIAAITLAAPWVALAAAIALVVGGILLATGKWEDFSKFVGDALKPVTDLSNRLFGLGDALQEGATPAQALSDTFGGISDEAKGARSEVTALAEDTVTASKKMVAANDNLTKSYTRMTAARMAANNANYADLMAKGGTQGSFTAVPDARRPVGSGGSITTLGGEMTARSNGSAANNNTTNNNQSSSTATTTTGSVTNFNFNIKTPDTEGFRRSRNQIASDTFGALG